LEGLGRRGRDRDGVYGVESLLDTMKAEDEEDRRGEDDDGEAEGGEDCTGIRDGGNGAAIEADAVLDLSADRCW